MGGRLAAAIVLMAMGAGRLAAAPLDPTTLAGNWAGTWQNLRFGSTGPITATVAVAADSVTITFLVSGGVFGCGSSPSGTLTLTKGTDYTDKKVKFSRVDPTFGNVIVRSQKKKIVAKGTGTCGGGGPPKWNVAGAKLKGTTFSGKMVINLGGGSAKTTFTLTRQ